jgi:DHA2 family multidrug resistance protein
MIADEPKVRLRDWLAIIGVSLGAFMAILDIQIVNASLREIQGALGLDASEGSWISTAYLIAEIIVIPLTGFCSMAFGLRNYLIFNSVVFLCASALCGLSWNMQSMICFRILQGLSGGTLIPMSFQCILTLLPMNKRNVGLAIFGLTATLAPTLGPAIGGYLTDELGWRSIFFLSLVPGLASLFFISVGVERAASNWKKLKELDWLGAFFLSLALASLTFILEEGASRDWFEDDVIRIATLTLMTALPLFFIWQSVHTRPLLQLSLLVERNFGLAAFITVMSAIALYGGVYATAVYIGQIQSYSARDIGTTMMWIGIPQLFVMPLLPYLMNRFDLRLLACIGFFIFAISNFLNGFPDANYAAEQFRFSLILRAIGQPLFMIPLSSMGMAVIRPDQSAQASSIYNMLRNLGGSIGIAMTSTLLVGRTNLHLSTNLTSIDLDDPGKVVGLYELQKTFLQQSFTFAESKVMAASQVLKIAYRDSIIQAFGDVYFLIALGLLVCIALVLAMKNQKSTNLESH